MKELKLELEKYHIVGLRLEIPTHPLGTIHREDVARGPVNLESLKSLWKYNHVFTCSIRF